MNLKLLKVAVAAAAFFTGTFSGSAKDYFVGPEANGAAGSIVKYRDIEFIVGQNAFTGIWSALGVLEENSRIYFSPNTVGNFTISKNNVELIGANA